MAKKISTPLINKTKKMKQKDAVALGRVVGKNPLSTGVIKKEKAKKVKNIESIYIKKKKK